jgi:pyruvate dehydrogenase E2 component (dihydrolipoamide acetyltransferase)
MKHDVVMPQLGLTMTEGSVSAWLKQPGDRIEKGEALFTVETDKVEMEVEATVSGYVAAEITEPKQVVPVGTVIAIVVDQPEEVAAVQAAPFEATAAELGAATVSRPEARHAAAVSGPVAEGGGPQYPVSPRARRLAKELGVDLEGLVPARGLRISVEDVERVYAARGTTAATNGSAVPHENPTSPGRAALAERVASSFRSAPHFYLGMEVDAAELVSLREKVSGPAQKDGVKVTYTDFFLKAIARALAEQPGINRFWQDGKILARQSIDVAFAVQADELLLAPVIRNADRLAMLGIARERIALAEKARAGKLTLPEMEGGSATLSNLGAYGVDWFQAILNPPQSVIVATGRIAKRPVVWKDSLAARDTLLLTASIDHRILDGVAGARFLGRIKELLEDPALLML